MTLEELKAGVPKHTKKFITQGIVDVFNRIESDEGEDFAETYKQNFVSHTRVMKSGEFAMKDYVSAVKFVSHRLLQHPDIDAYMLTFPDRYQRLITKYAYHGDEAAIRSDKISPYVSAYKQNGLVVRITEQALVAPHILNAPMFQQALNIQMQNAMYANSEIARVSAAESVMKHTRAPEVAKIELEIGVKGQDEIMAMRMEQHKLASLQQLSIETGSRTSKEIAESDVMAHIIDVEDEDA